MRQSLWHRHTSNLIKLTPSRRSFGSSTPLPGQAGLAVKEDYSNDSNNYEDVIVERTRPSIYDDQPTRIPNYSILPHLPRTSAQVSHQMGVGALPQAASLFYQPYHVGRQAKFERIPYWQRIPRWRNVSEEEWLDYSWGVSSPTFLRRHTTNDLLRLPRIFRASRSSTNS